MCFLPVIKLKELRPIRDAYWKRIGKDTLFRHNGVVFQRIWFDRLSTGYYRPAVCLGPLVAPCDLEENLEGGGGQFEAEELGPRRSEATLKTHERLFEEILKAFEEDVCYPCSAPLETERVLALVESEEYLKNLGFINLFSLACFYAYLGNSKKFFHYTELVDDFIDRATWDDPASQNFLREVETWLKSGTAKEKLTEIAKREVELLKIID